MIRVVVFEGGLGNQMFEYAFYLQLLRKNPGDTFAFDIQQSCNHHCGFELDKIFEVDTTAQIKEFQRVARLFPKPFVKFNTVRQRVALEHDQSVFRKRHLFLVRYVGYWQSEKYFCNISDLVRTTYQFKKSLLNEPTRCLSDLLRSRNYVSVHIRRGDYLKLQTTFGLCSDDYYDRALEQIKEKVDDPVFVFFSDEIEWAKNRFGNENALFVDWNKGKDSWQDMFLMTQCKHNIIANSTFSWWGAWLNPNERKIVVAPKKWFEFTPNYDVLPETWIAI